MSCEQVTFHQRDADAQEEQQDGDRSHYDPPEVGICQRNEEKQAPPEEYFAKVVGVARKRPQSRWNHLPGCSWPSPKALHLEICRSFDDYSSESYQGGYDIQPGQLGIAITEGRP